MECWVGREREAHQLLDKDGFAFRPNDVELSRASSVGLLEGVMAMHNKYPEVQIVAGVGVVDWDLYGHISL